MQKPYVYSKVLYSVGFSQSLYFDKKKKLKKNSDFSTSLYDVNTPDKQ